jgi:hypothetical protein
MSTDKKLENKEPKYSIPYSIVKLIIGVIDSIRAKGGRSSKDIIKAAMGTNDSDFHYALASNAELGLIQQNGDEYELTPLGQSLAIANDDERKKIMLKIVVGYEPYHTILWRIKNNPSNTLSKDDVTKAWFAFNKSRSDRIRQEYTRSFASICDWIGIMENNKNEVKLNEAGISLLENTLNTEHMVSNQGDTSKEHTVNLPIDVNSTPTVSKPILAVPINASITVTVVVDTKDEKSVENLLKILKALKGET